MKKQLCLILAAVLLGGCSGAKTDTVTESKPESSAEVRPAETAASTGSDEPDYITGKPWMVIDIAGNVTEDTPVNVKDDFAL